MRYEVTHLDDNPAVSAEHRSVVDLDTAKQLVEQAAKSGDRLHIRPVKVAAGC
ncbi:hypothetical protein [Mangrovactinospora gilvigrisea]|uniref:hypothetical protein n=1 Tax=Mangrovactinospora gilvigrisea TaxID=1428644 RepID=UPI000AF93ED0|nr:hypothetical protein [Mangrovactinospora gilvigrisea]